MKAESRDRPRRSVIKSMFASLLGAATGAAGAVGLAHARTPEAASSTGPGRIVHRPDRQQPSQQVPRLFSGSVTHNGLVYVAGKGYHGEGDITKHTNEVLDQVEEELVRAGSSMDRVLKVNVYLHDIKDYSAMNDAYRGRFGEDPPVRTTVACYGGIPGNSLVEIDCIAALNDS